MSELSAGLQTQGKKGGLVGEIGRVPFERPFCSLGYRLNLKGCEKMDAFLIVTFLVGTLVGVVIYLVLGTLRAALASHDRS
jgi:hypothetical protein